MGRSVGGDSGFIIPPTCQFRTTMPLGTRHCEALSVESNDMPDTTEAFWIIKNGIKYTGMPAFGPTHSNQKIWAITDFLLNKLNKMSPQEYQQWYQKYARQGA